ncbi:GNAT family N-acetyltransferase [Robiginitalea sp. SC105]|uniref:GNAT family N-acetyltransferase n=1 Tax=Robiginitalea sp. SC105 TaxID=2762332 RepID=UPI001639B716|nr:GNAT family N-acetyltransferase [Robiginitalea sp. SC105]MBC2838192.1 GNAT family N-acetyltransferase [Robiginitalea sp. SC105]
MEIRLLTFEQLSARQVYEVLRLRAEIFVVEQECAYCDPDGMDEKAYHLLGYEGGRLAAYTRIFPPGQYLEQASIGRVAVHHSYRGRGFGREIMQASLEAVVNEIGSREVVISAQVYLVRFYNELGFTASGAEYLEDGIPHIKMYWKAG